MMNAVSQEDDVGIYDRDYMRQRRSATKGSLWIQGTRIRWWVALVMAVLWLLVWFYVIPLGKQNKAPRKPPPAGRHTVVSALAPSPAESLANHPVH